MEITVTLTAHPDLMAVLKTFAENLAGGSSKTVQHPASKTEKKAAKSETAEAAEPVEPIKEEKPETASKAVTIELVRKTVQEKAQEGKRDAVKQLLSDFSVERVTELEATQYPDFLKKVAEL